MIGQRLGPYEITDVIGTGGMATVDYANRQGITHRDLKPSNMMIDREGDDA